MPLIQAESRELPGHPLGESGSFAAVRVGGDYGRVHAHQVLRERRRLEFGHERWARTGHADEIVSVQRPRCFSALDVRPEGSEEVAVEGRLEAVGLPQLGDERSRQRLAFDVHANRCDDIEVAATLDRLGEWGDGSGRGVGEQGVDEILAR